MIGMLLYAIYVQRNNIVTLTHLYRETNYRIVYVPLATNHTITWVVIQSSIYVLYLCILSIYEINEINCV